MLIIFAISSDVIRVKRTLQCTLTVDLRIDRLCIWLILIVGLSNVRGKAELSLESLLYLS
jgi:hypothetical protein